MQLILLVFLTFSGLPALCKSVPPIAGNWTLSFEDDFDSLNQDYWNLSLVQGVLLIAPSVCFFVKENVNVANGNLQIISKEDKLSLKDRHGDLRKAKYSSGLINSSNKFAQKYGYFEARMKLPQAEGLWPSFWLMPNRTALGTGRRPKFQSTFVENASFLDYQGKGMEIDIMESLTRWGANKFHYAAHWDGAKDKHQMMGAPYQIFSKGDEYRKFGLYWGENILIWFTDDKEVYRWESERIADVPMYLILSTQMGGWAKDIDAKNLPDITYVDYVRVWSGQAYPQKFVEYDINSAKIVGKWEREKKYFRSKRAWFRKNQEQKITWNLTKPGKYRIALKWTSCKKKLAKEVKVRIGLASGEKLIELNQNENSNYWYELGEFDLAPNSYVTVDASETNEYVLVEGLRLELIK